LAWHPVAVDLLEIRHRWQTPNGSAVIDAAYPNSSATWAKF